MDYFQFGKNAIFNLKTGIVRDEQVFNQLKNISNQYFLSGDWEATFSSTWSFKTGLRFNFIQSELSTYQATDQRIESYQSLRFDPIQRLRISINLRQLTYLDQFEPLIPSLGADWDFWKSEKHSLSLKSSLAKGIKVPTLNDRFWEPGGNPDLLPEKSQQGEIGLAHQKSGDFSLENSLTYYRMNVDNWIIWLPKGTIWTPENIREVSNQGLEYEGKLHREFREWKFDIRWSYTYTLAVSTKGIGASDPAIGRQLPYTPQNQANGQLSAEKNNFTVFLGTNFVGTRRVTIDGAREMPAYQLVNLGFTYQDLTWKKFKFPISLQVNNLLNTNYQVLYLRAMPGRSFQFTSSIQF